MHISKITIEKLFGDLDYDIPLKFSEVATIIYAPNGYGKTTVLEIIDAIFHLNFQMLCRYIFSKATLSFADGCYLEVQRIASEPPSSDVTRSPRRGPLAHAEESDLPPVHFTIRLLNPDGKEVHAQELSLEPAQFESQMMWRSALQPLHSDVFRDARTGRIYRRRDLSRPTRARLSEHLEVQLKDWLRVLVEKHHTTLVKTKRLDAELIEEDEDTQRAFGEDAPRRMPSVLKHSREMAEEIQAALSEFSNLSQQLDRQFPGRLMKALDAPSGSLPDIKIGLQELDAKYHRIVNAGILEKERFQALSPEGAASPITQRVMALYVQDQQEKLKVFDPLLSKIETLRDLINARFQRKELLINRQRGYLIRSLTRDGLIPLDRLSSGEQHELVLFHSLLFNMRPESLVMIDEPEISLHVAWQEEFLRDLARISANTGVHFLIATHSPQIISDRWDLAIDLAAEPKAKE